MAGKEDADVPPSRSGIGTRESAFKVRAFCEWELAGMLRDVTFELDSSFRIEAGALSIEAFLETPTSRQERHCCLFSGRIQTHFQDHRCQAGSQT